MMHFINFAKILVLVTCSILLPHAGSISLFSKRHHSPKSRKSQLALVHVPFNFGHTIEKVAWLDSGTNYDFWGNIAQNSMSGADTSHPDWSEIRALARSGAEVWGAVQPELRSKNKKTGCPNYLSPQKYWDADLAEKYFGNKTTFGMLRDPYERLVAIFRGQMAGYGSFARYQSFYATCDVDGAVRQMMLDYSQGGDKFRHSCVLLPQAEYFEGYHGIQEPIDNRLFPDSVGSAFSAHGYGFYIGSHDIMHVSGCDEIWAGNLTDDTKALVKQVYERDFDLLCKKFGYCDKDENTCMTKVEGMCPARLESLEVSASSILSNTTTTCLKLAPHVVQGYCPEPPV